MKKLLILASILPLFSCGSDLSMITVSNPAAIDRSDEGIILTRSDIESRIELASDETPAILDANGAIVPYQLDDLDGDGSWDELFFLCNLKAGEEKSFELTLLGEHVLPEFIARTNVRLGKKLDGKKSHIAEEQYKAIRESHATNTITEITWQMEGPAWENDKLGFRNYFDQRNGNDIFGKITTSMVLDSVGLGYMQSYHEFNPSWGMDVLKVGNSLGSGSLAIAINDSLCRVGDNGIGTYQLICEGPLRSIFRLEFRQWKAANETLNLVNDIEIRAGKYYYESSVKYDGTTEAYPVVTGIVNKKSKELVDGPQSERALTFYSYDKQSEDGSMLGMGLLVFKSDFLKNQTTASEGPGVTETYATFLTSEANKEVSYRFYSVWEFENERWKSAEGFEELLKQEVELAAIPVTVK